jgi:hypothetical protein
MFRLLGTFVGSLISVVIILMITGIPKFHEPRLEAVDSPVAPELPSAEPLLVPPEETEPEADMPVAILEPEADVAVSVTESQWYSFWNPFRSKLAASGFVQQLEKVTGFDYRVVKIKTGVYEVAFAYDSDDERRRKLALISSATGLELPDS